MICGNCQTEMEQGYCWLDHVLAGGLFWNRERPEFNPLLSGPSGDVVTHSHCITKEKSLREAHLCPECQTLTIVDAMEQG